MDAKELSEEAERKENLEYILFDYNSNIASNGGEKSFTNFLSKMKDQGKIEDYIYYSENLIVKYDGYYYELVKDGDFYKVSKKMTEDLGSTGGSLKIVTPDNIQNAKDRNIKFEDGDEFIVLDNVKAEDFNFIIPPGAKVTIKLLGDMTLDNKNTPGKSAIDLEVVKEKDENEIWKYSNGATLDLYIYGNVEVNSSFGEKGEDSQSGATEAAKGGPRSKSRNSCSRNSDFKFVWNRNINSYWRGCWKWWKYAKSIQRWSWTVAVLEQG